MMALIMKIIGIMMVMIMRILMMKMRIMIMIREINDDYKDDIDNDSCNDNIIHVGN